MRAGGIEQKNVVKEEEDEDEDVDKQLNRRIISLDALLRQHQQYILSYCRLLKYTYFVKRKREYFRT